MTLTKNWPDMTATICQPDRIIKKSPQWEILRHRDGETADIIETILYADSKSKGFVMFGVDCLKGASEYDTLKKRLEVRKRKHPLQSRPTRARAHKKPGGPVRKRVRGL